MKRIIEYNPDTATRMDIKREAGETVISHTQDVTPILEQNKLEKNTDITQIGIKKSWMKLASIPNTILHKWMIEDGIKPFTREGIQYITKKVHERDYAHLKVATGNFVRKGNG